MISQYLYLIHMIFNLHIQMCGFIWPTLAEIFEALCKLVFETTHMSRFADAHVHIHVFTYTYSYIHICTRVCI